MSTKEQTLSWLAELPEDSPAWRELHDDARLLRDIAVAEDDVRNGRAPPLRKPGSCWNTNGLNVVHFLRFWQGHRPEQDWD